MKENLRTRPDLTLLALGIYAVLVVILLALLMKTYPQQSETIQAIQAEATSVEDYSALL